MEMFTSTVKLDLFLLVYKLTNYFMGEKLLH